MRNLLKSCFNCFEKTDKNKIQNTMIQKWMKVPVTKKSLSIFISDDSFKKSMSRQNSNNSLMVNLSESRNEIYKFSMMQDNLSLNETSELIHFCSKNNIVSVRQ